MNRPGEPTAGQIIRQRRSLLGCDAKTSIPAKRFYRMLERILEILGLGHCQRVNTTGGTLEGSCQSVGALVSVPYTAEYRFLQKVD